MPTGTDGCGGKTPHKILRDVTEPAVPLLAQEGGLVTLNTHRNLLVAVMLPSWRSLFHLTTCATNEVSVSQLQAPPPSHKSVGWVSDGAHVPL